MELFSLRAFYIRAVFHCYSRLHNENKNFKFINSVFFQFFMTVFARTVWLYWKVFQFQKLEKNNKNFKLQFRLAISCSKSFNFSICSSKVFSENFSLYAMAHPKSNGNSRISIKKSHTISFTIWLKLKIVPKHSHSWIKNITQIDIFWYDKFLY